MSKPLSEQYRPETFQDLIGNKTAVKHIRRWTDKWKEGTEGKPQLLAGDAGVGKTTTCLVAAKSMGWPLVHINASNARRTDDIKETAEDMQTRPADAPRQVILLDEIDSLPSSVNLQPLYDALSEKTNPIMATANEKWKVPDGIKNRCKVHNFKLNNRYKDDKKARIRSIAEQEGINLSNREVGTLATRNDFRAILQDLQAYGDSEMEVDFDNRELDSGMFSAVDGVIQGQPWKVGRDVSPPDLVDWLYENVSDQYRGIEAAVAYNALAYADQNLARTHQNDYYYWKFAGGLAEMVGEVRLTEPYDGYIHKQYPLKRRNYPPNAESDTAEARLYRSLSEYEDGRFVFGGGYRRFRHTILPLLQDLSDEEKYELAMEHRLEENEVKPLGIEWTDFDEWRETESPETGTWEPDTKSLLDY